MKYSKDKEGIINCDLTFKQCDKDWDELKNTSNPFSRFCLDCERMVERIDNPEDLKGVIEKGKCVAYFVRKEPPLIGMIAPPIDYKKNDNDDELPF